MPSKFGIFAFKSALGKLPSILGIFALIPTFGKLPSIFGIFAFISTFGILPSILGMFVFKSIFGIFPSIFGISVFKSIFGIFPSIFGISALISALGKLPSIFGIFALISAFGILAPKDIFGPFIFFPFKLRLADGICNSGVLIFISFSISGTFAFIFGTLISGPFISPSTFIPPFILGISTFFVPFIIPENITSSFGNLIFKSGDFTFGISPSILIFALCWFFKSTFGPFILIFADGISIFGDLIWVFIFPVPLISPFIFGPSISSLLEPLILTSGLSKCNFDVLILISGWFIL